LPIALAARVDPSPAVARRPAGVPGPGSRGARDRARRHRHPA